MPELPHLQWPVRLVAGHLAVLEQDSLDDVVQCVEVLTNVRAGTFIDTPELGWEDPTFSEGGPSADHLAAAIAEFEPRAAVSIEAGTDPSELSDGTGRLRVSVELTEEG